jgi:hypothetical protein
MARAAVALLVATSVVAMAAVEDKLPSGMKQDRGDMAGASQNSDHLRDVEVVKSGAAVEGRARSSLTFLTVLTDPQVSRLYTTGSEEMMAINTMFGSARQHHEAGHDLRLAVLSDEITEFGDFADPAVEVVRVRGSGAVNSSSGDTRAVAHFLSRSLDSGDTSHVVVLNSRVLLLKDVSDVFEAARNSFDVGLTYRDAATQIDDAVMFFHGRGKKAAAKYLHSMAQFARHSGAFNGIGRRQKPPGLTSAAERMSDSVAGHCEKIAEVPVGTPVRRVVPITNCLHFGRDREVLGVSDYARQSGSGVATVDDILDVLFNGTRIRLLPCEDYNWGFRGMRKHVRGDTVPKAMHFHGKLAEDAMALAAQVLSEADADSPLEAKWAVFNLIEDTRQLNHDLCSDSSCAARCAYFQISGVPPTFECSFLPPELLKTVQVPSAPQPPSPPPPPCVVGSNGEGSGAAPLCQGNAEGPSKKELIKREKSAAAARKVGMMQAEMDAAAQAWKEQLRSSEWAASEVEGAQYYHSFNGRNRTSPKPRLVMRLVPVYLAGALTGFVLFALFRMITRHLPKRRDKSLLGSTPSSS